MRDSILIMKRLGVLKELANLKTGVIEVMRTSETLYNQISRLERSIISQERPHSGTSAMLPTASSPASIPASPLSASESNAIRQTPQQHAIEVKSVDGPANAVKVESEESSEPPYESFPSSAEVPMRNTPTVPDNDKIRPNPEQQPAEPENQKPAKKRRKVEKDNAIEGDNNGVTAEVQDKDAIKGKVAASDDVPKNDKASKKTKASEKEKTSKKEEASQEKASGMDKPSKKKKASKKKKSSKKEKASGTEIASNS